MIVDDVYTTGTSFKEYCDEHYLCTKPFDYNPKVGCFCKSSNLKIDRVRALFTMPSNIK